MRVGCAWRTPSSSARRMLTSTRSCRVISDFATDEFVRQGCRDPDVQVMAMALFSEFLDRPLIATGFLRGMLFAIHPLDAATLVGAAVLLVVATALASSAPVRRAARADVMTVLRSE